MRTFCSEAKNSFERRHVFAELSKGRVQAQRDVAPQDRPGDKSNALVWITFDLLWSSGLLFSMMCVQGVATYDLQGARLLVEALKAILS